MEMNYDESTLQQLEDELHTKIYPGTEIMSDVGSHHFVKAGDDLAIVVHFATDTSIKGGLISRFG